MPEPLLKLKRGTSDLVNNEQLSDGCILLDVSKNRLFVDTLVGSTLKRIDVGDVSFVEELTGTGIPNKLYYNTSDNKLYTYKNSSYVAIDSNSQLPTLATVASTGSYSDLVGTPETFTPSAHSHAISEITSLSTELNGKITAPSTGTTGQYLQKTATGTQWATITTTDGDMKKSTYDTDNDGVVDSAAYATSAGYASSAASVVWSNVGSKPSSFTPSAHSHAISDVTNLQSTLDNKAASNHNHNGVYASATHSHAISDVTSLSTQLGDKITNPSGGSAGDVLKKTSDGVEWGSFAAVTVDQSFSSASSNAIANSTVTNTMAELVRTYCVIEGMETDCWAGYGTNGIPSSLVLTGQLNSSLQPTSWTGTYTGTDGSTTITCTITRVMDDTAWQISINNGTTTYDLARAVANSLPWDENITWFRTTDINANASNSGADPIKVYRYYDGKGVGIVNKSNTSGLTLIVATENESYQQLVGTYVETSDIRNGYPTYYCAAKGRYLYLNQLPVGYKWCFVSNDDYPSTANPYNGMYIVSESGESGHGGSGVPITEANGWPFGITVTDASAEPPLTVTWDNVTSKPTSFTPAAHSHTISDVTNLQSSLDSKLVAPTSSGITGQYLQKTNGGTQWATISTVTVDSALSSASTNAIQNKAVYSALSAKIDMPNGGSAGYVLKKTSGGVEWGAVSSSASVTVDSTFVSSSANAIANSTVTDAVTTLTEMYCIVEGMESDTNMADTGGIASSLVFSAELNSTIVHPTQFVTEVVSSYRCRITKTNGVWKIYKASMSNGTEITAQEMAYSNTTNEMPWGDNVTWTRGSYNTTSNGGAIKVYRFYKGKCIVDESSDDSSFVWGTTSTTTVSGATSETRVNGSYTWNPTIRGGCYVNDSDSDIVILYEYGNTFLYYLDSDWTFYSLSGNDIVGTKSWTRWDENEPTAATESLTIGEISISGGSVVPPKLMLTVPTVAAVNSTVPGLYLQIQTRTSPDSGTWTTVLDTRTNYSGIRVFSNNTQSFVSVTSSGIGSGYHNRIAVVDVESLLTLGTYYCYRWYTYQNYTVSQVGDWYGGYYPASAEQISNYGDRIQNLETAIGGIEGIEVVSSLPANPSSNVLYLVTT